MSLAFNASMSTAYQNPVSARPTAREDDNTTARQTVSVDSFSSVGKSLSGVTQRFISINAKDIDARLVDAYTARKANNTILAIDI